MDLQKVESKGKGKGKDGKKGRIPRHVHALSHSVVILGKKGKKEKKGNEIDTID